MTDPLDAAQTERALLGSLLLDRDAIASVVERVQPDAFALPRHADLYRAFLSCWERRIPPDIVTVCAALQRQGWDEARIDTVDLVQMMIDTPQAVHAPYYANLVVEHARARAIADAGLSLVKQATDNPALDPAEAMQTALSRLPRFGAPDGAGPIAYMELVPDFQETVMRHRAGETVREEAPTGFRLLDFTLRGGFRRGEMTLLGARPGVGKTALALQVMHNIARRDLPVLMFSAEMSAASLMWRAVAEVSGVAPRLIEENTLPAHRHDAVLKASERMLALPIQIDDTSGITVDQMIVRTQRAMTRQRIALVVFDYLELAGDTVKGESEERRVGEIGRKLKHLARVCNVAVLALCQLSRQPEARQGNKPRLSDLRYSGALEAHADVVLLMYRHDYYVAQHQAQPDAAQAGIAEVIVAKHRNGPTGTVALRFQEETMSFREIDTPEKEQMA